jgi:hypothetical protein
MVALTHLSEQLCSHAVEVDRDAEGQSAPVLKPCEALSGNLLADDVDGRQLQLIQQLPDV